MKSAHQERTIKTKRSREGQIIGVLKEADAGVNIKDLCWRHDISEVIFYNWKATYVGMTVSDAQRLTELEYESARLKRLLTDVELDKAALKDLLHRRI